MHLGEIVVCDLSVPICSTRDVLCFLIMHDRTYIENNRVSEHNLRGSESK